MKNNILTLLISILALSACTQTVLKAPCNAVGTNCGTKIKINNW